MITDLRVLDDETALVKGERYDLEKVLGAMCGILDDYAAFAKAEGLAEPHTLSAPAPVRPDDDWVVRLLKESALPLPLPYGSHTPRLIRRDVMKVKEKLDAGGFRHPVEAPPYRFDLYPLAQHPLYANFGLCRNPDVREDWTVCDGPAWTEYDPAPFMRIFRHLPPRDEASSIAARPGRDMALTSSHLKLLTSFLETQKKRGIAFETRANGLAYEPVTLSFPHALFGAGHGDIRVALLRAGGD